MLVKWACIFQSRPFRWSETADHMDIMHAGWSIEKYTDEWVWILKPEVTCSCMATYRWRNCCIRIVKRCSDFLVNPLSVHKHTYTYTASNNCQKLIETLLWRYFATRKIVLLTEYDSINKCNKKTNNNYNLLY